jgi:hypothetical protein
VHTKIKVYGSASSLCRAHSQCQSLSLILVLHMQTKIIDEEGWLNMRTNFSDLQQTVPKSQPQLIRGGGVPCRHAS